MEPSTSSSPDLSVHEHPDDNAEPIKDWTQKEKYNLFRALKTLGRHDMAKIQEKIGTKNLEETKAAVDYFTGLAHQHPFFQKQEEKEKQKSSRQPCSPLTAWVEFLTDNLNYNELSTETATALRMIADLENIPPKEETENIDFRQVYHQMANAIEGKPLSLDAGTAAVFHKFITEASLESTAFLDTATVRSIVNNIDFTDKEVNNFPRPTEDQELAIIRHLASQRNYNPLKIDEEYLKPKTSDKRPRPDEGPSHR